MAFFARRGLEMAQFAWFEPLEKPQGVKEGVVLPELKRTTRQALQPPLRESRCLRGTAGSRSLMTQTYTHTNTHVCLHPPPPSSVLCLVRGLEGDTDKESAAEKAAKPLALPEQL